MKLIVCVLVISLYGLAQSSLVDLCAELVEHDLQAPARLEEWCEIQMAIVHLQATADSLSKEEFEMTDANKDGVKDKRKNEFIRFGKRKNEFIRFGKRDGGAEQNSETGIQKRKNEFIRFGKRKNEFIRFGKRKNEFIRFGKKSDPSVEDLQAVKRKNEFIRFG